MEFTGALANTWSSTEVPADTVPVVALLPAAASGRDNHRLRIQTHTHTFCHNLFLKVYL